MSTPDPERRVSIWSVPERWRRLYFAIFSAQTIVLLGLSSWFEIAVVAGDSWVETIFAISKDCGPGIAVIAAGSVILTEVYFVVIFGGIVERYQQRLRQREAEGVAKGVAKGAAEANEKWVAWNQRRLDAEAAGQPFTEPPPSATENGQATHS